MKRRIGTKPRRARPEENVHDRIPGTGKPLVGITLGDVGGIGPEVVLKALSRPSIYRKCRPVVIGDAAYLKRTAKRIGLSGPVKRCVPGRPISGGAIQDGAIHVLDVVKVPARLPVGRPSRGAGRVAGKALEVAVDRALSGEIEGIVTAPVSKESFDLAGYGMVGHTELLAGLTGTRAYAMMLMNRKLRVVFATTHVPLKDVARRLTRRVLLSKIALTREYLDLYLGIRRARIGVACLNPHGGEGGNLGREEETIIEPAIRSARAQGMDVAGPYPADSIYRPAVASGFDAIIAMYHDQGMIPLKLRGHGDVVNLTLGIPCVRTSPGHGTAFDLVGKGPASDRSMRLAILECAGIAKRMRDAG
jgi:4-hydroxythreonine-4-phosphate dehydrogenase